MREVEGEKGHLARNRRLWRFPAKTPGNHQVDNEEQLTVCLEHDSLAQATEADDGSSLNGIQWRINRAEEKRRREAHAVDRVANETRAKRVEVKLDVGKFGHAPDSLSAWGADMSGYEETGEQGEPRGA